MMDKTCTRAHTQTHTVIWHIEIIIELNLITDFLRGVEGE